MVRNDHATIASVVADCQLFPDHLQKHLAGVFHKHIFKE